MLYIYIFKKQAVRWEWKFSSILIFEHFNEVHSKYGNELWRNDNENNNY